MFRRCGTKNYFSWDEPILPKLVRELWKNAQAEADCIRSVIGKEIAVDVDTISKAINCFRFNDCFQEEWDEIYAFGEKVERTLYGENFENKYICNDIIVEKLSEPTKTFLYICRRTFLHNNSNNEVTNLEKFAIYHLMDKTPFNLPHLIFIHLSQTLTNQKINVLGSHYSLLSYRILVKKGILDIMMTSSFPAPTLNNILTKGTVRGQKLSYRELGTSHYESIDSNTRMSVEDSRKRSRAEEKSLVLENLFFV
ncbi:hypothetical protein LR48_Vigan06g142100 [Vigna angularis]|uniref:Putative plant transposon protein domain-containing protein n=1 Tax=Phaseolus angularis TaxID=3914 RepID=A0A0L9UTB5_PHAAN|nr:hypothetical protein LR48_Vigan06g142100 [Vigna angularis]